jgi:hypothetical protein
MAIVIRGHQQVRKVQRVLGGEPRAAAMKKAKSEMSRYLTERLRNSDGASKKVDSILAKRRDLLLKKIHERNPHLKEENAKFRRILEQRVKRKIKRPRLRKMESRIASDTAILTPPYDAISGRAILPGRRRMQTKRMVPTILASSRSETEVRRWRPGW